VTRTPCTFILSRPPAQLVFFGFPFHRKRKNFNEIVLVYCRHWRIQEYSPVMPQSGLSRRPTPPQPAKNVAWADGHWASYSTYRAKICPYAYAYAAYAYANKHVRLLNLLWPDGTCFHESKWSKNALAPGALHAPDPAHQAPTWTKGEGRERKRRDGTRGMGERRSGK